MAEEKCSCRLYALLASDGKHALILRRGPRHNTLLVNWDLRQDRFEEGQWVKHKIYERRCGLSPDGKFLIYFAAKFVRPFYSWTAISRTPYFSALALWPKIDCWGGGGLLAERNVVMLNHRPEDQRLIAGTALPPRWTLRSFSEHAGGGEDWPVEYARLSGGGWLLETSGESQFDWQRKTTNKYVTFDPPQILARTNPRYSSIKLRRLRTGVGIKNGKHYEEHFEIYNAGGSVLRKFETFDWADWDRNGDLLLADDGKVWRLPAKFIRQHSADPFAGCSLLIDLKGRKFQAITPPDSALQR